MHLPYFTLPPIDLRGLGLGQLDWFSVFVAVGIVVGVMVYDRVVARGGDVEPGSWLPEVTVVGGLVGAHLVHVLAYHPELMHDDPWVLVKVWAGISSVGGFAGAAVAASVLLRLRRQPFVPYADRLVVGLTVGWVFGRLGCATAHDHPGSLTDFPLGVAYPDGVRHDLGLYELLLTLLVLLPMLIVASRRPWRTGTLTGLWLAVYGAARLGLDVLRATDRSFVDARYLGLTPAQYASGAMLVAGLGLLVRSRRAHWSLQPPLWGRPELGRAPGRDVV
jgi:phosphatidylglycerol:prolipoprotein diacylglycerol transferase